jgi:ribonuclease P protein component
LVLCALPNGLAWSRFGFSVSKQVGKAVVRNRVRRRMREAVRLQLPAIAPGWDVVFIARRSIAQATYEQIAEACQRVLARAELTRSTQGVTPEVSQP